LNILLRVAFVKSIILSFLAHFVKNKKHTNLNTCLDLYSNQKQNENKRVQRSLYKPKLLHFFDFEQKSPFRSNASSKEASQWRNIARNHANIDIILIHERPSVSLLPSNNPQGKRAQELARAI
jgi:hypothetical protein